MSSLLNTINSYIGSTLGTTLPQHALWIAGLIVSLSGLFVVFYFLPGIFLWLRLFYVRVRLYLFKRSGQSGYPTAIFAYTGALKRLWHEYQATLHEQHATDSRTGAEVLKAIRSTVSADTFFHTGALVDGPLHVEFFKHLPGIFTGMGIIGTFVGLMHGLGTFQVSEDTQVVRHSLDQLLRGVSEAFVVSLGAVFLAMVVTFFEKLVLAVLYRQVEKLCLTIDGLYTPGAGEEYLERLVKSSESSARSAEQMKEALVSELRDILREMASQTQQSHHAFGDQLRQSLQEGITVPLQDMMSSLHRQQVETSQTMSQSFEGIMAVFSQRLQGVLSRQTQGLDDVQQKTLGSLENTAQEFQHMIVRMDTTSRETTAAMAKELTQVIQTMGDRQQAMGDHITSFAGELRTLTQSHQRETGQMLRSLFGDLGQHLTQMVSQFHDQSQSVATNQQEQQQKMSDATVSAMGTVSAAMQQALQAMQGQLTQTLTGLGEHADQAATQQRQIAMRNEQVMENLGVGVEQAIQRVLTQTSEVLTRLTSTIEQQQQTITTLVARMAAEMQSHMQAAAAEQQNQYHTMTSAALATMTNFSSGVQSAQNTMQSQLTHALGTLDQYTHQMAAQQQEQQRLQLEQQRHLAEQHEKMTQHLAIGVDQTMGNLSVQTRDLLLKLTDAIEGQQNTIAAAVTKMVFGLQSQMQGISEEQQDQQRKWIAESQQAVQHLSTNVDQVVNAMSNQSADLLTRLARVVEGQHQASIDAVQGMQKAIAEVSTVTTSALDRLHQGVDKLTVTAEAFGKAGDSMVTITHNAEKVAGQFTTSAEAVAQSVQAMESIVGDYSNVRQQVNEMVQALQSTVDSARKEAALTADVLQRIDQAAQKLATAQMQADKYLAQVTNVLEQTHQDFSAGMRRTVGEANQQFFHYLTQSISLLKASIGELDTVLNAARTAARS